VVVSGTNRVKGFRAGSAKDITSVPAHSRTRRQLHGNRDASLSTSHKCIASWAVRGATKIKPFRRSSNINGSSALLARQSGVGVEALQNDPGVLFVRVQATRYHRSLRSPLLLRAVAWNLRLMLPCFSLPCAAADSKLSHSDHTLFTATFSSCESKGVLTYVSIYLTLLR
jgi:hypothetical protein